MSAKVGANPSLTDEEVVASVLSGNVALYEVLVRRHNQKIYRAVRAVLREDRDVEDVMQQAYLSAYLNLAQFRGGARFSTWLVRIAVHAAQAKLRKQGRLIEISSMELEDEVVPMESPQRTPEERAGARQLGVVLESLIADLSTPLRTVFVLREMEGMSTAEVAESLQLSEDNVKTRLHRAKAALRDGVARRLGEEATRLWRFEAPRCDVVASWVMERVTLGPSGSGGGMPSSANVEST